MGQHFAKHFTYIHEPPAHLNLTTWEILVSHTNEDTGLGTRATEVFCVEEVILELSVGKWVLATKLAIYRKKPCAYKSKEKKLQGFMWAGEFKTL